MSKTTKTQIKFEYKGTSYVLEYTADSLRKMQERGFNFSDWGSQAITAPEDLFAGAFYANHNSVPAKRRKEIFHDLCEETDDGEALLEVLGEMISEAIDEITNHSGNTKWEVVR